MDQPRYPKLHEAVRFAVKMHLCQDRLGEAALPYSTHAVDVLMRLRHGAGVTDESCLCAAVLHDVVEECDATHADIERKFGPRVSAIVKEVTREEPTEKQLASLSENDRWALRTRLLLSEIERMSDDAKRLKLADRASNLVEGVRTRSGEKLHRYLRQSQWILERIDRALAPALWDEIERSIEENPLPREFAELSV